MFDKIKQALTGATEGSDIDEFGGYGKYLKGIDFPIGKEDLIVKLQDNGATDAIVEHVQSMAQDQFSSGQDVFKTVLPG